MITIYEWTTPESPSICSAINFRYVHYDDEWLDDWDQKQTPRSISLLRKWTNEENWELVNSYSLSEEVQNILHLIGKTNETTSKL